MSTFKSKACISGFVKSCIRLPNNAITIIRFDCSVYRISILDKLWLTQNCSYSRLYKLLYQSKSIELTTACVLKNQKYVRMCKYVFKYKNWKYEFNMAWGKCVISYLINEWWKFQACILLEYHWFHSVWQPTCNNIKLAHSQSKKSLKAKQLIRKKIRL